MNTTYEVIWIDDEWDKMTQFKEECKVIHHINLHPFRTQKAGMDALDNDLWKWDAIILDAMIYDQSEENEKAKLTGLRKAIDHINQLYAHRPIPYFISTGQTDLMTDETFKDSFGKYYIKERDDLQLISDIKETVSKSTRYQVKSFYPEAIEQLASLNEAAADFMLDILETMHFPASHPDFKPVLYYNQLRQILEWNYREANKFCIIPNECIVDDIVNLNQCSCYLSGKDARNVGIRYGEKRGENDFDRIVPQYIENMIFLILNLGNINSHTTILNEKEQHDLDLFLKSKVHNSRYLIFSLALQMCEITLWMKKYIENHHNIEENKSKCNNLDSLQLNGDVIGEELIGFIELHDGIYHIGDKFYLNPKTIQQRGWLGKKVKVIEKDINTNSASREKYPFFACKVQPVTD